MIIKIADDIILLSIYGYKYEQKLGSQTVSFDQSALPNFLRCLE